MYYNSVKKIKLTERDNELLEFIHLYFGPEYCKKYIDDGVLVIEKSKYAYRRIYIIDHPEKDRIKNQIAVFRVDGPGDYLDRMPKIDPFVPFCLQDLRPPVPNCPKFFVAIGRNAIDGGSEKIFWDEVFEEIDDINLKQDLIFDYEFHDYPHHFYFSGRYWHSEFRHFVSLPGRFSTQSIEGFAMEIFGNIRATMEREMPFYHKVCLFIKDIVSLSKDELYRQLPKNERDEFADILLRVMECHYYFYCHHYLEKRLTYFAKYLKKDFADKRLGEIFLKRMRREPDVLKEYEFCTELNCYLHRYILPKQKTQEDILGGHRRNNFKRNDKNEKIRQNGQHLPYLATQIVCQEYIEAQPGKNVEYPLSEEIKDSLRGKITDLQRHIEEIMEVKSELPKDYIRQKLAEKILECGPKDEHLSDEYQCLRKVKKTEKEIQEICETEGFKTCEQTPVAKWRELNGYLKEVKQRLEILRRNTATNEIDKAIEKMKITDPYPPAIGTFYIKT